MRDTDKDWAVIAADQPYYGVFTNPNLISPDAEALREFFESGDNEVSRILQKMVSCDSTFSPTSALDFGCGVGRLTIPLAKATGRAVGVDVAQGMRVLAEKHAAETGTSVSILDKIPTEDRFDWVNSIIVLQHIPPRRGYDLIRDLWGCVAPGGFITLHITIYRAAQNADLAGDTRFVSFDGERTINYTNEEARNIGLMSMYDYDLSRVLAIIDLPNGASITMEKTIHGPCHGVIIYAQKARH